MSLRESLPSLFRGRRVRSPRLSPGWLPAAALAAAVLLQPAFAQPAPPAPVSELLDGLVARTQARPDRTLDILVLSGGGQHGAWGTGFLRGWRQRASEPMPAFDLVTGISTGSFIAPFALVGTDEALDQVTTLYRNAVDEIKPSVDPLFFIRRTGGVLRRGKMERTIERVISPAFARRLQDAFAENRQLLVGTTDLESGVGHAWPIGRVLTNTHSSLKRFHSILMATSAIPGAFAPVELDGHPHIDGGLVTNLLLGLDLADFRELADRLRQRGLTEPVRVRLWVLVNLWVKAPAREVNARSIKAIRDRSNTLQFILKQQLTLTRFWELSQAVTSGVPGLSMEVRYTSIPVQFADTPGAMELFDGPYMRRLDLAGFERAQSSRPWDDLPLNPYERAR